MAKPHILPDIQMPAKVIRADRCERCKFSEPMSGTKTFTCHKGPPSATVVLANGRPMNLTGWPVVEATHWCGDWHTKVHIASSVPEASNAFQKGA